MSLFTDLIEIDENQKVEYIENNLLWLRKSENYYEIDNIVEKVREMSAEIQLAVIIMTREIKNRLTNRDKLLEQYRAEHQDSVGLD